MTWERTARARSAAPPDAVWAVLLDGRRWSFWNHGVAWLWFEEEPPRPGTLATMKPRRGPQTAFRVEDLVPPRRLALLVTFGPVAALRFVWELVPDGDGTAIAQTIRIDGPLAGLLKKTAARIAEAAPANLERLAAQAAKKKARS